MKSYILKLICKKFEKKTKKMKRQGTSSKQTFAHLGSPPHDHNRGSRMDGCAWLVGWLACVRSFVRVVLVCFVLRFFPGPFPRVCPVLAPGLRFEAPQPTPCGVFVTFDFSVTRIRSRTSGGVAATSQHHVGADRRCSSAMSARRAAQRCRRTRPPDSRQPPIC